MNARIGTAAALAGSAILVGAGAFAAVPSVAAPLLEQTVGSAEDSSQAAESGAAAIRTVEGSFSYDQGVLSSNDFISQVFAKAAASLCESLPEYSAGSSGAITVSTDEGSFAATVDELADEKGAHGYVMGCACASNIAGGGAIANAEVTGVSLESLAELAGA